VSAASMHRAPGSEQVEVEIGDGLGTIGVSPDADLIWCRLQGRPVFVQWFSTDPIPPEGTHVTVQRLIGDGLDLLCYPPDAAV
jgi:hypothetical protein